MGMTLRIRAESNLIRATVKGEFSLEEAERNFLEIMESVAQQKAEKVLLDARELRGSPRTIHRFYLGKLAAREVVRYLRKGKSRNPQFAYVGEPPLVDPRRLGETVAVNRGVFVKVFDNCEDALKWLGLAPAEPVI
jgi:hypothetical protein